MLITNIKSTNFGKYDGFATNLLIGESNSGSKEISIQITDVEPNGMQFLHSYKEEQCYYIISGSGKMLFDDQSKEVKKGDAVFIPSKSIHGIENIGKDVLTYITYIVMIKPKSRHKGTPLRKREIIEAALVCFSELGYDRTGVSDIRERACVSTGSLYHHFGSKEQLAGEVYLEGIRDYQAGYLSALEKETNAEKGIHAIVEFHLKWVSRNRQWARYLFRMRHLEFMAQKENEFDELNKVFFGRIAAWFRKQIEAGAIRRLSPDLYPAILMGPCQEFAREYLADHTGTEIGAASKQLAAAVWRALGREHEKGG